MVKLTFKGMDGVIAFGSWRWNAAAFASNNGALSKRVIEAARGYRN